MQPVSNTSSPSEKRRAAFFGILPFLPHLAAMLVLFFSFWISSCLFFPGETVGERFENILKRQSGASVSIEAVSLSPLARLIVENMQLQPGWNLPSVTVDRLAFSPLWRTLLGGPMGAAFQASLLEGSVSGRLMSDGSLQAFLSDLAIAPLVSSGFRHPVSGTFSGAVSVDAHGASSITRVRFDLVIRQAAVAGLDALGFADGMLSLGEVRLQGELQGRTVRLMEIANTGGDLRMRGLGSLNLETGPGNGRLKAELAITPVSRVDAALLDLLALTGVAPDNQSTYHFSIAGSLREPVLQ